MHRSIISLALLASACGSKAAPPAIVDNAGGGGGGAGLQVVLAPASVEGMDASRTLAAAPGSTFPAVSADGTTIVHLVEDAEDFSGIPIATVVFWTKDGVAASFQLVSAMGGEATPDQTQREEAVLAEANARLAATTWRPLAVVEATGEDPDTGAPDTITLGDGTAIVLREITAKFPAPGVGSDEIGGGGCGDVLGLTQGFGARELGFAVVFPRVMLGGDSCFGLPSAELAIAVPIP